MRKLRKVVRQKILVTVKTCPSFSRKYNQVVCTAGITAKGQWIRIYPVQFMRLSQAEKFKKYQWIEVDVKKDSSDPRPESYKIHGKIRVKKIIGSTDGWKQRKALFRNKVKHDLSKVINNARDIKNYRSLAMFKPKKILRFVLHENLDPKTKAKYPYKFYYQLADKFGKKSEMQIIDWEIYELCRKLINKYGKDKDVIYSELKRRYFDYMIKHRDVYLFLGTNKYWHIRRSGNPFMIVGIFYPPK